MIPATCYFCEQHRECENMIVSLHFYKGLRRRKRLRVCGTCEPYAHHLRMPENNLPEPDKQRIVNFYPVEKGRLYLTCDNRIWLDKLDGTAELIDTVPALIIATRSQVLCAYNRHVSSLSEVNNDN